MSNSVTRTIAFAGFLVGVFFLRCWSTYYTNQWVEEARESSKPTFPVSTYPAMYMQPMPPIDTGRTQSFENRQKPNPRTNEQKPSRTNPPPRRP